MARQPSNASVILDYARRGDHFGVSDVIKFFESKNRNISAEVARSTLNVLKKKRLIDNPKRGVYCWANESDNTSLILKQQPRKLPDNNVGKKRTIGEMIIDALGTRTLSTSELLEVLNRERNISRASLTSRLAELRKSNAITSPLKGYYQLVGGNEANFLAEGKKVQPVAKTRKRNSEWLDIFERAFEESDRDNLTTNELVEAVLRHKPAYKNPAALVYRYADGYPELIRVSPGVFTWYTSQHSGQESAKTKACNIDSFGIYWSRADAGIKKIQLSGQDLEGEEVDKTNVQGIYVLYRNDRIVYVGRAISQSRGIGVRLTDHTATRARLKNRWDSFSFFEIGGEHSEEVIKVIEAILIEVTQPPENRQAGDGINPDAEISQSKSKEVREMEEDKDWLEAYSRRREKR